MGQGHFIRELRPIPKDALKLNLAHYASFHMSLFGGLAWTVQTRPDKAVFAGALQRRLGNSDVLNLGRVLKYERRSRSR